MSTLQKVIKYLALAFAIMIIVNIVSAVLIGIYGLSGILGLKKQKETHSEQLQEITANIEESSVTKLKIDLKYSNLKIQEGEIFKTESNCSSISCIQNNNLIEIKEKDHNWFSNNDASELVVTIPEDMRFEKIEIENGAGEINIENLTTNELEFDIGAGKVEVQELNVSKKAEIDGGAGKVEILSGTINNLDLDMGVGETTLKSILLGKNDINSGVGKLNINLIDGIENYKIKIDKGLGSIKIDGEETEDGREYGNGENYIKVDGGVGAIEIKGGE